MTERIKRQLRKLFHGVSIRQVRLVCGVILFAYLVSHFLNHALGNVSAQALTAGVYYHVTFWQFLPIAIVFYTACTVHTGLGVWALYDRRQFRWKAIEPLQLVLGLSIPAMIISHIVGVRVAQTLFDHEKLYPQVFYAYWIAWPYKLPMIFVVLVVAWGHGCIGLHFWLRMKTFYKRAAPFLLAAAVLIPAVAMLGLYQGGRAVVRDSDSAQWKAENLSRRQVGTATEQGVLEDIGDYFLIGYAGLIGLALVGRGVRALTERRGGLIKLSYGNGKTIRMPRDLACSRRVCATTSRMPASAAVAPAARPAASEWLAISLRCRSLRTAKPLCSTALERAVIPRSASRASCGRKPTCHFFSSSCQTRRRRMRTQAIRRASVRSAISSACSWTCADRRCSPKNACRSIPCSSSIESSRRYRWQ